MTLRWQFTFGAHYFWRYRLLPGVYLMPGRVVVRPFEICWRDCDGEPVSELAPREGL